MESAREPGKGIILAHMIDGWVVIGAVFYPLFESRGPVKAELALGLAALEPV